MENEVPKAAQSEPNPASHEIIVVRSNRILGAVPAGDLSAGPPEPSQLNITDIYTPYDLQRAKNVWRGEESEYFEAYRKEYTRNPFMVYVIESLLNMLFREGYHFEGDGAEDVAAFFKEDKTEDKLKLALRHMIWCGNGYLERKGNQKVVETDTINGFTVFFKRDIKGSKVRMVQRTIESHEVFLKEDRIIHFKMLDLGNSPYGMSLIRPNFYFLMALRDTMGDIPAAVKRVAYAPVVAYLDLEGVKDDATKKSIMQNYGDKLHAVVSATSNYVMDKRHQLALVDGNAQNLDTRKVMEPLFAVVFLNFHIPLGAFLQADSNQSVMQAQMDFSQNGLKMIQRNIANKINQELLPFITSKDVRMVWNLPWIERWNLFRLLYNLWVSGAISTEYLHDQLDIDDTGKTFVEIPERGRLPGGGL